MSEYQRFISYLYGYKDHVKLHNHGFLKAESRNGYVKIELHITDHALAADIPVEIYGYIRKKDTLQGILLGNAKSNYRAIHCRIEFPHQLPTDPSHTFAVLNGVIILCNGNFSYASAWDDLPIEPSRFSITESRIQKTPDLSIEEVKSYPSFWENLLNQYEQIDLFSDDSPSQCIKLSLKDLTTLKKDHWFIGNNPFILYAYTEHQHVILGHILSGHTGHDIFGIPGNYHPKEKFMAELYGFPYFKASQNPDPSASFSGYWYRFLT